MSAPVNPFVGVNADAMDVIGTLLGKVYQQGDEWEHPACDVWLKQWRAARGEAGLDNWQWWIGEVDGESFALPFDTREKAIAAAPAAIRNGDLHSEDGSYWIVEARCWADDITAGDDIMWFAEQRNEETLRVVTAPGLIKEGELPELWGHFELHPNGLRVIKVAPITDVAPISREFLAALLRRASDLDRKIEQDVINRAIARDEEATKRRIDAEIEARTRRYEDRAKEAEDSLQAIYEACGLTAEDAARLFWNRDFARAVGMVHKLGVAKAHAGIADLAKKIRTMADAIDGFMEALPE